MPLKQDISDASLAELMGTKISTVSRKPQTLSDTPAAVFVISQEDIRRASANSIPPAYPWRASMRTNGR